MSDRDSIDQCETRDQRNIRESTLRLGPSPGGNRDLTPPSDRAWNLGTAFYYKSGGRPWRLSGVREGVCYIGLAYKKQHPSAGGRTAACAAQMFLDSGDGIVFLGEFGPWYSPELGSATSHVMVLVDCYREYWTPTTSLMDGPCESYSSR